MDTVLIKRLNRRYDVSKLQRELTADVWDEVTLRTAADISPHRETSDIWVRYNPMENYHGDIRAFNAEHTPAWYPIADRLPEAKRLSEAVCKKLDGKEIGMVLITRIPPGKQVYPHVDVGWHARTFEKFCISVKADKNQCFYVDGQELVTEDGDLFTFDNSHPHWVKNDSLRERISLIICIRRH